MRPIDWNLVSDDRGLTLITVKSIAEGDIFLADFKDIQALAFNKTKHFLGLSKTRGIRLGGHPLRLIDGVWYITEDLEASVKDLQVSHDLLCLQLIR